MEDAVLNYWMGSSKADIKVKKNIIYVNNKCFIFINSHIHEAPLYWVKIYLVTLDITCLNLRPSQQCIYPLVDMTASSDRLLLKHIARTLSAVLHGFFVKGLAYTNEGTSDDVT